MRSVSSDFKAAMKAPVKQVSGALVVGVGDEITSTDYLISYTIDTGTAVTVGGSVLRKITATYIGTRNLVGQLIEAKLGVKIAGGSVEFVSLGSFLVTQAHTQKDKDTVTITGYDRMVYSIIPYLGQLAFTYPTTVSWLYTQIAAIIGQDVATSTIPLGTLDIIADLYENIGGTKYRDVIQEIAALGGAVAMIDADDKIALRNIMTPDNTVETLSYDDLRSLTLKDKYGEVNSLVLSRQPQEDNVIWQDETSITANGLTEVKIVNNQIIDKIREDNIEAISAYYFGTTYYPFEATTVGLGYLEIGDAIQIEDSESVLRDVRVMGLTMTVDGGLKEKIWSDEPSKTETNYARAGGIDNRIKNTELIVDKQAQEIISIVSDIDTLNGTVNDNYTQITQDINAITQSVQHSGGLNLLKNSVGYATNNSGFITSWDQTGTGTITTTTSPESLSYGAVSGNQINISGASPKITQRVIVLAGEQYTLSAIVKKAATGAATIKLKNTSDEFTINLPDSTAYTWQSVVVSGVVPTVGYFDVEIASTGAVNLAITDIMLNVGSSKTVWQQANGEILNLNVSVDENGIKVKSNIYGGDFTAMTPIEFAGYSDVSGSRERIFGLNRDETFAKKLTAESQITMPPIKIVPILTGAQAGWAFVVIEG